MPTFQGSKNGADQRIGVVVAQFNELVTERLKAGALAELQQLGVSPDNITTISVPGAFELPRAAQQMSLSGRFDGIIALGAVVRGETDHYQYVCGQTAAGLAAVSLNGPIPVMFGVLTTDTLDQAINRAGGKAGNKGRDCAAGVLEMIGLTEFLKA